MSSGVFKAIYLEELLLKCIPLTFIGTSETKLQIGSNFENNRYTKGGVTFAVTNSTLTITNNFIGQLKIGYDVKWQKLAELIQEV